MTQVKSKGEQVTWKDVNGREHTGEVVLAVVNYTARTPDGMVYEISKKIE